jgi:hypothetical protein
LEMAVYFPYDKINDMYTVYYNGTTGRAAGLGGYFGKRSYDTQVINLQDRLTYVQDFGKHHVDALALYEDSDWEQQQVSWGSYDEFIPGFLAAGNFVGRYGGAGSAPGPSYGHDIERMKSWLVVPTTSMLTSITSLDLSVGMVLPSSGKQIVGHLLVIGCRLAFH